MNIANFKFLSLIITSIILTFHSFSCYSLEELQETHSLPIIIKPLTIKEKKWFYKELVRSYISVYKDVALVISKNNKLIVLTRGNYNEKIQWLNEAAKEEFSAYVLNPKDDYKAIQIFYKQHKVGALLYRLHEKSGVLYLGNYFIVPEMQKKHIGFTVIDSILPKLHPSYKRYEVLARHQNYAAFTLYNKLNFVIGDDELVKKYEYNPLQYLGFYKNLS